MTVESVVGRAARSEGSFQADKNVRPTVEEREDDGIGAGAAL
jgi:hypothetical protein